VPNVIRRPSGPAGVLGKIDAPLAEEAFDAQEAAAAFVATVKSINDKTAFRVS
jgi:hypothetical protein